MPARDIIHDIVKNALIKDGWTITADPCVIAYDDVTLYADLGAERPIAAQREERQIVVEIKSFLSPSPIFDFKSALGQYELYRAYLEVTAPGRELFLAISHTVFDEFFQRPAINTVGIF